MTNIKPAEISQFLKKQLEKRVPFRKAIVDIVSQIKQKNSILKGLKIQISGRLNGAEIARSEWIREGSIPLNTLKANIDYTSSFAQVDFLILRINFMLLLCKRKY